MKQSSDFVFKYIHALTPIEIKKLVALLEIDGRSSEVKLLNAIREMQTYSENLLIKKLSLKPSSFHTIKSDLKKALLTTMGYNIRLQNQVYLNQIGLAQSIQRMGFYDEGNELFEIVEKKALTAGDNLSLIYSNTFRAWSVIFNGTGEINSAITFFENSKVYSDWEANLYEFRLGFLKLLATYIHDPLLKYFDSYKIIKEVENLLAEQPFDLSKHQADLALYNFQQVVICFFNRNFDQAINKLNQILASSRFPKRDSTTKIKQSNEIAYFIDILINTMMLKREISSTETAIVYEYVEYINQAWLSNPLYECNKLMYQVWLRIKLKNKKDAEKFFFQFIKTYKKSKDLMFDNNRFRVLYKMMLLSLNFSSNIKNPFSEIVQKEKLTEIQFNKTYSCCYYLFNLFNLYDVEKGYYEVHKKFDNSSSFHLLANSTLDIFKKRKAKADYDIEILVALVFTHVKTNLKLNSLLRSLQKIAYFDYEAHIYTQSYIGFFDFREWAKKEIKFYEDNVS